MHLIVKVNTLLASRKLILFFIKTYVRITKIIIELIKRFSIQLTAFFCVLNMKEATIFVETINFCNIFF